MHGGSFVPRTGVRPVVDRCRLAALSDPQRLTKYRFALQAQLSQSMIEKLLRYSAVYLKSSLDFNSQHQSVDKLGIAALRACS